MYYPLVTEWGQYPRYAGFLGLRLGEYVKVWRVRECSMVSTWSRRESSWLDGVYSHSMFAAWFRELARESRIPGRLSWGPVKSRSRIFDHI